jgi:hypothetical protein
LAKHGIEKAAKTNAAPTTARMPSSDTLMCRHDTPTFKSFLLLFFKKEEVLF